MGCSGCQKRKAKFLDKLNAKKSIIISSEKIVENPNKKTRAQLRIEKIARRKLRIKLREARIAVRKARIEAKNT